jgi:hypothetical protein
MYIVRRAVVSYNRLEQVTSELDAMPCVGKRGKLVFFINVHILKVYFLLYSTPFL